MVLPVKIIYLKNLRQSALSSFVVTFEYLLCVLFNSKNTKMVFEGGLARLEDLCKSVIGEGLLNLLVGMGVSLH